MTAQWSSEDKKWMAQTFILARQNEGYTNPNPMVGTVIVKDGRLVGQGCTQPYGHAHAEQQALQQAEAKAQGATLYVNWEPCMPYPDKQTRSCALSIIESGIARVVISALDPHPEVNGKGIEALRNAGIQVDVGLMEAEALALNEVSHIYHTENRPFVCLKWAMTLDGKIATHAGDSKWVSGEASRAYAHQLRHRYAAILVGVNTVIEDNPSLNVRHQKGKDPYRIVVDSQGRIPLSSRMLYLKGDAPTIIATTDAMPDSTEKTLTQSGSQVWRLPDVKGRVDLNTLLQKMKSESLDSVLVEGGGEIHWSFLSQKLFDKVVCFIAPKIAGGQAQSPVAGSGVGLMRDALELKKISYQTFGEDVCITGYRI